MQAWIPAEKVLAALKGCWPDTIRGLAQWVTDDAPSAYLILQTREVVETLIRADALDATALAKLNGSRTFPSNYQEESIGNKMEALRILNIRISTLGLDRYVDVTPILYGGNLSIDLPGEATEYRTGNLDQ